MKDNFIPARIFMGSVTNIANRPWRRLVTELGAEATLSEMVIAHYASKGGKQDLALMRRADTEKFFGVQLVGNKAEQLVKSARYAVQQGADFIDFNCACPHQSVISHGAGASMLRRPEMIAQMLNAIKNAVDCPVTLKIRKGYAEEDNVAQEIVHIAEDCGVAAVFIHARTRADQYRGLNDWELIESIAQNSKIPIIGCGDLAHGSDVINKMKTSACAGFALARGALMKPWIFQEIKNGAPMDPSSEERLEILKKLVTYSLDDFGRDEYGYKHARKFLHNQLVFLNRYIPTGAYGRELPMQEREVAWTPRDPLEKLMNSQKVEDFDELLHLAGFDDTTNG